MDILELLKGKKVKLISDLKTEVILTIDWWGEGYYNYWYIVTFTNGIIKEYNKLETIEII